MTPTFFSKQSDLRKWFQKHYTKETELLVGFYKVGSGKTSITWPQSVDEALCFGWIDGIRKSIDADSYCIRFTPRRATSIWSAINIQKVEELKNKGLMQPAGLASFEKRRDDKSKIYSHEIEPLKLDKTFERKFKANKKAWIFFQKQAPYYKRLQTYRIMTGKQEKTRISRLEILIKASEEWRKI